LILASSLLLLSLENAAPGRSPFLEFAAPGLGGPASSFALSLDGRGLPRAYPLASAPLVGSAGTSDGAPGETLLARLRVVPPANAARPPGIVVVPASGALLLINGFQAFGLRVAKPGDLVSVVSPGRADWLLVERLRVEPHPAPAALAAKPCSLCGLPLAEAPIATCACGGLHLHCQNPHGDPDSETELNCFLREETCSRCGRPRRLGEHLVPDPETLGWPAGAAANERGAS
jgi:hypothetical protein